MTAWMWLLSAAGALLWAWLIWRLFVGADFFGDEDDEWEASNRREFEHHDPWKPW